MATEGLTPATGIRGPLGQQRRQGSDTAGGLPPDLERRIAALERPENQGRGFGPADWAWLALLGVVLPAALLIWGWPG